MKIYILFSSEIISTHCDYYLLQRSKSLEPQREIEWDNAEFLYSKHSVKFFTYPICYLVKYLVKLLGGIGIHLRHLFYGSQTDIVLRQTWWGFFLDLTFQLQQSDKSLLIFKWLWLQIFRHYQLQRLNINELHICRQEKIGTICTLN